MPDRGGGAVRPRGAARTGVGAACLLLAALAPPGTVPRDFSGGIHKIRHIVIIVQENRSFDSYFGTFPGADGIPTAGGTPTVCVPDPATHGCVRPFHDRHDLNHGGPHDAADAFADIDGGRMDGFIAQARAARQARCRAHPLVPACGPSGGPPDVLGYHDGREIPNYWAYARHFVLQDHMFESVSSWSLPSHLYLFSAWSALCSRPAEPMTCRSSLDPPNRSRAVPMPFGWTELTYLLHRRGVSWAVFLDDGGRDLPRVPAI